jgi:hypothetical protein
MQVSQVFYLTFMCGSICFWCLSAHHQEHTSALGTSNFTVGAWRLERCWSWSQTTTKKLRLKCDGTRAETRFLLSAKRTSPFKTAEASVQSTTGSRTVRISGSNAGYTMFRGSVTVLATHSILLFALHFPSRASPCAITFLLDSPFSLN